MRFQPEPYSPDIIPSQGRPLLDRSGRVFAVLAGSPKDTEGWKEVLREAKDALEYARAAYKFEQKKIVHRRGKYAAITCGISYGGGQRVRSNLVALHTSTITHRHV